MAVSKQEDTEIVFLVKMMKEKTNIKLLSMFIFLKGKNLLSDSKKLLSVRWELNTSNWEK